MDTAADVVNEALQLIGDHIQPVTGIAPTFDNSAPGKAVAQLYTATVTAVGRVFGCAGPTIRRPAIGYGRRSRPGSSPS